MSSKRRLDTPYNLSSSSGNLILKEESGVRIGEAILDSGRKKVGWALDLFVPGATPFLAVKPVADDPERCVGELPSWG